MGSSGKGIVQDVLSPVTAISRGLGMESGEKSWLDPFGIGTLDPMGDLNFQAFENTMNWVQGREDFGVHQNWFGDNAVADSLSQMMGGSTEAQRQQIEFDETMAQARQDLELTRQVKMAQAKATNAAKTEPVVKESGSLSALTDDDNTLGNTILT